MSCRRFYPGAITALSRAVCRSGSVNRRIIISKPLIGWGASLQTGKSTDCSGFVQYLYRRADIHLPRVSAEQARVGKVAARSMDFSRLLPGDLLFFHDGGRRIGHEGIYLGEGKMIHAASHSRGVTVSDLRQSYYQRNFVVAKRLFAAPKPYPASVAPTPAGPAIN